jgi:EmrB/QacA subfamily drug resistance transporter
LTTITPNPKRWSILAVLCIVLFIISIDNTVLNLAIPSISEGLGATTSQLQWVVDMYTLVFASLLITTGTIGDRFGRKKLLTLGLSLFGLGSLGAAFSNSTSMLIGFRALLGVAGAMIMPSTLSIIINVFTDHHERARAIAIWSSIFSIGAGIGPIIGGFLINSFHWSSVFLLNVPIVLIGLTGAILLVPESKDERAPRPDFLGVVLSIVGLLALIFAVISAGERGFADRLVWISFAVAVVFLAGFMGWENRSENPMLPLHFFKNRSFSGANAGLTISSFAMMGSMYFFSQYLQTILGYSPILAAVSMFPMTPAVFLFTMLSVRVDRRLGTKKTMSLGLLLSGLGFFLFSQFAGLNTPYWQVLLVQIVLGSGIGFTMSPATNSIMSSLPPNRAGIGSAMNDTTRQLGGALGVAVLGALMNGIYRAGVSLLGKQTGIDGAAFAEIMSSVQNAHLAANRLTGSLVEQVTRTSSQAFVNGMDHSFLVASIIMGLATIATYLLLPVKPERAVALPEKDTDLS